MREAIGGTWLFQIVIVFILLFTGFLCLSINRSKAFNVKDQIIQTIQSYNGIDLTSEYEDGEEGPLADIISYISSNSYRTTGNVPEPEKVGDDIVEYVCYTRDGRITTSNPVFCIAPIRVDSEGCASGETCFNELPDMTYYRVVVFYQLDLPIFHDLFNFKIVGDTKTLFGGASV
ncbi:TPA: hypothetical protein IAB29_06830 [Candidatus Ventrenecus stercoripullorum]|nr:hypothetical protein [Candidatus Ventrenecus stercoripullorum]